MKERLITGIDLGSSVIRLAVGQVTIGPDKRETLSIIGAVEVPSQGISKGVVTSLEDTVSALSLCLEQAERQIGLPLQDAYVGVNGTYITVNLCKGVIGVSRPDGDIREEDIRRALESVRTTVNPSNFEILHLLPRVYTVDGQVGIKDPIGMQGIRLEVDAHVVQGISSHLKNISKSVQRTGVDIAELVFTPLAFGEAVTNTRQREVGVAVVNIGASTTGICVYEAGELLHAAVVPIGSDHVTSDIAIGLRTSLEVADQLKKQYISAYANFVDKRDELDLQQLGAPQSEVVSLRFVADIAQARVEEIFERVGQELKKIDRAGMLAAGAVLTGGGAKLQGMVEVAKEVLRLPASLGATNCPPSPLSDIIADPVYSTSVGLVRWGMEAERGDTGGSIGSGKSRELLGKASGSIMKIFKSFIP
ncbi:MAG: cell division protein FtsA [Patescibacteria group bacterium]